MKEGKDIWRCRGGVELSQKGEEELDAITKIFKPEINETEHSEDDVSESQVRECFLIDAGEVSSPPSLRDEFPVFSLDETTDDSTKTDEGHEEEEEADTSNDNSLSLAMDHIIDDQLCSTRILAAMTGSTARFPAPSPAVRLLMARVSLPPGHCHPATERPVDWVCFSDDDSQGNSEEENKSEDILDPTDSLIIGKLHHSSLYLESAANRMSTFVSADGDDDIETLCRDTVAWMRAHPMVCQVRYSTPEFCVPLFPLTYFAAAGWLEGVEAAYHAWPEAIGQCNNDDTGLPLHYACLHSTSKDVISFLVSKFPEATRRTNGLFATPLHLFCRSSALDADGRWKESKQLQTVQLLLRHYPTAAQLADIDGYTPFQLACQRSRVPVSVLQALEAPYECGA